MPFVPFDGRKTVTTPGTEVKLSDSHILVQWLHITPLPSNSGNIYVGSSTVDARGGSEQGMGIQAPFAPITLTSVFLDEIYIDASVGGEGVAYGGVK